MQIILEECYGVAKDIITTHKDKLEKMAERLLEKETIDLLDIVECFGERPFPMEDFMKEYLDQINERKKQKDDKRKQDENKILQEDESKAEEKIVDLAKECESKDVAK
jgi:hypothetical protein